MTLRKIQLAITAVILSTLFFTTGLTHSTSGEVAARNARSAPASSLTRAANWTFEGCWTQFSAGPCRDVYRDRQGNHHICLACGTTGSPGPGKCNPISQATLNSGLWCS